MFSPPKVCSDREREERDEQEAEDGREVNRHDLSNSWD